MKTESKKWIVNVRLSEPKKGEGFTISHEASGCTEGEIKRAIQLALAMAEIDPEYGKLNSVTIRGVHDDPGSGNT